MVAALADWFPELSGNSQIYLLLPRLAMAAICGMLIGVEREMRSKEAGVRTHFLVCFGSALFTVISAYGFSDPSSLESGVRLADHSRVAAQIVSGIGFIGAGTIMVNRGSITGLTTAAGLWVAAAIGMALGCGFYITGILSTLLMLCGLAFFRVFFHRSRTTSTLKYRTGNRCAIYALEEALQQNNWRVISHDVEVKGKRSGDAYRVTLTLHKQASLRDDVLLNFIRKFPDITLEEVDSQK